MRVISLYSFKGGVGRTSLALNLAYQLALQAKFVVLADWDLHAPGLSLMDDLAMPNGPFPRKGILDFLWSALGPLGTSDLSTVEVIDPLLLAQTTILAERSRIDNRSFGDILFVPAGQFGSSNQNVYPDSLRKLHLPDLVTWRARLPGSDVEQSVLRFFCERISAVRSEYFGKEYPPDFLLLDSRTGITEIGDLLLGYGVDHYVVLFGLNEQNQAGMEMIVRGAQERVRPGGLPDALSLIASPVPVGEEDLLRERLTALNTRLGRLARPLDDGTKTETLPSILRIPYHPRLALREEIIIEKYPESALAQTYRDITTHILRQERTLKSAEANTRVQVLADVPSRPISDALDTYALYASHERTLNETAKAPRPYVEPPPWNWADPKLKHELLVPGVPAELSRLLLDGIAWSNSLRWREKLRVMEFAATLPAPRVARLAEPFLKERENQAESWEHDWKQVEGARARAATDWIFVLGQLRHVGVYQVWKSVAGDSANQVFSEAFASSRLLYLIAHELMKRRKFRSSILLFVRALSGSAFAPVSARAKDFACRLASLDTKTVNQSNFAATFPSDAIRAFQSVLDLHSEDALSIARAMAGTRRAGWTEEASLLGHQIWSLEVKTAKAWQHIANEYRLLRDFENTERAARRAIAQRPESVTAWVLLATSLVQDTSRSNEAHEALQRAEQLVTDTSELRHVAVTLAEDFQEYERALHLYERVVNSDEPGLSREIELAEIAVAAHAKDAAHHALARARILLDGPIRPEFGFGDRTQSSIVAFYVVECALAMLDNDRVQIETSSKLLMKAVTKRRPYGWRFDALMSGLKHLPDNNFRLLKSATALAQNGDVAAFESALANWSQDSH